MASANALRWNENTDVSLGFTDTQQPAVTHGLFALTTDRANLLPRHLYVIIYFENPHIGFRPTVYSFMYIVHLKVTEDVFCPTVSTASHCLISLDSWLILVSRSVCIVNHNPIGLHLCATTPKDVDFSGPCRAGVYNPAPQGPLSCMF